MTQTETQPDTPPDIATSRGIGLSEPILLNPATVRSDSRMVARAIKERWPVPEDRKAGLVDRLFGIVAKTFVTVMDKTGNTVELDDKADTNAIAAARVIVAMEGQNQEEERPEAKAPTINIGIGIRVVGGDGARPL